ncbi:MAG: hypothetical protein HY093_03970 [Candidatus Liptonbacteria bacterium]|nr:hypothetical protein [Candidatus Liptonbacteria bacterium]
MLTVTIPKTKYEELKKKASAYEHIFRLIEGDLLGAPPTRSAKEIMAEFKKTSRYNPKFLKSLKRGLARSAYFKK